jgi:hypothetical protein
VQTIFECRNIISTSLVLHCSQPQQPWWHLGAAPLVFKGCGFRSSITHSKTTTKSHQHEERLSSLNEASRRFFSSRSLPCERVGLRGEGSQRSTLLRLPPGTPLPTPNHSQANFSSTIPTERKASWPHTQQSTPHHRVFILPNFHFLISNFPFPFSATSPPQTPPQSSPPHQSPSQTSSPESAHHSHASAANPPPSAETATTHTTAHCAVATAPNP